jgi:zinc protease
LKQVSAQYVYSAEGVTNQAFWLGQMEIVDSYRRVETFLDAVNAVTPADVQRVVRTHLVDRARTVGWLLPEGAGGGTAAVDAAEAPPATMANRWFYRPPAAAPMTKGPAPFERAELPNGMVVLTQPRPAERSVVVRLRFEAGAVRDPDGKDGLANLTARMLPRGGERRSFAELNEATDALGASLSTDAGRHFVELSVRCLREDLPRLLDLAADVLRRPLFPEEELEKVRNEVLTGIREADNDTRATADRLLRRLLFPSPHPYGRRVAGDLSTVPTLGRADLVAFHRAAFGPAVATVAMVGGIDDANQAADLLGEYFGDWTAAVQPPPDIAPPPPPMQQRAEVGIPGKSQANLALGFPTPPRSDPAYYALDTANLILGRLGLMGRLGASVRDEQGLAYSVGSQIEPGREVGLWLSRAGVDPANVDKASDGIVAEVRRLARGGVSKEEMEDAKSFLTGILPLALESNDGVAATLLNIEYHRLGLDYLERYRGIIQALTTDELVAAWATIDPDRLAVAVARPTIDPEEPAEA